MRDTENATPVDRRKFLTVAGMAGAGVGGIGVAARAATDRKR